MNICARCQREIHRDDAVSYCGTYNVHKHSDLCARLLLADISRLTAGLLQAEKDTAQAKDYLNLLEQRIDYRLGSLYLVSLQSDVEELIKNRSEMEKGDAAMEQPK